MEILIIIVLLFILAETSYLVLGEKLKAHKTGLSPVFVDTSVLIDGRIISISESGFITRPLYVPRSVVGELQFLADNADSEKRIRARHGLDVVSRLQALTTAKTTIFADGVKADEGVDNRLLSLAKKHGGAICTIDYNLNKVAVVEGIEVLNVNELAKTLRMAYLPGEKIKLELTQKGNDQHQAVGHLEDGTMVVVEHAYKQIGTIVEVEFIRSLQTAAGKMMFAKLVQPMAKGKSDRRQVSKVSQALKTPQTPKSSQAPKAQQAPNTSQASKSPKVPKAPRVSKQPRVSKPKSSSRRPRSVEDSMVELANK